MIIVRNPFFKSSFLPYFSFLFSFYYLFFSITLLFIISSFAGFNSEGRKNGKTSKRLTKGGLLLLLMLLLLKLLYCYCCCCCCCCCCCWSYSCSCSCSCFYICSRINKTSCLELVGRSFSKYKCTKMACFFFIR